MGTRSTRWFALSQQSDAAADDSDKTFTVPAGKVWFIKAIGVTLVTTATVGNRQLDVLITDAADATLVKYAAGAVQAASLTRYYYFAPLHPQDTSFSGAGIMYRALAGDLTLPAGFKVRVYDSAAIAAAADDLTVRIMVEEMTE